MAQVMAAPNVSTRQPMINMIQDTSCRVASYVPDDFAASSLTLPFEDAMGQVCTL